jgi:hypothetical protein
MTWTSGAETERLLLLPWTGEYSADFARLCADPEAMRFITGGRPLTEDEVGSILQRTLARRWPGMPSTGLTYPPWGSGQMG